MRFKIKLKLAKMRLLAQSGYKQAQKLALAVVIMEYLIAGGYYLAETKGITDIFKPKTVYIEITRKAEAKEIAKPVNDNIEDLADIIYLLESSNGVNDQKCERIGLNNGYGYAQGVGKNFCKDTDDEVRELVIDWLKEKRGKGMSDKEMLCYYNTGIVSGDCEYIKNIEI